jgi:diadenosine tetraphosphatase ApaH/serine/threonine PP2A family protein phosphatase
MKGTIRKQIFVTFTGMILLAAGCSSKTKPTDKNFMTGLNAYYANHNECLFPSALRFPYEVSPGPDAKRDKQRMDALMDAGLMKRTEDRSIHVDVYALTPAGERAGGRFCYGHRQVTSIDSFTPPIKNASGFLESHVTYHYKMMEVPVWAKTDEVQKAFPEATKNFSDDATGEITMANAGVGWQVPS